VLPALLTDQTYSEDFCVIVFAKTKTKNYTSITNSKKVWALRHVPLPDIQFFTVSGGPGKYFSVRKRSAAKKFEKAALECVSQPYSVGDPLLAHRKIVT
jgi:hypothetical protein